ncbi:SAM-dependent methyltransferase [Pseudochryseolinea flava]|uniref:SAM-dependent methyltransferase n=1 Tax=Pseudochryseolinea flava TaxID=2059302 RepID=A0A364YAL4_9BACT|nr:SAM-dependent methyltransferase [Pseudochryseolinea flava]RAW03182.1 SAM-dependent methyltransferase [Pseudochryseolinea flava]
MNKGILYLIPNLIAPDTHDQALPPDMKRTLATLKDFLAEDVRSARRFLSSLKIYESIEALNFQILDKETRFETMGALLDPLLKGNSMGVLSESGCPGIADPGALAARWAHENGVKVIPLVGPSSILLALMASGLNGQRFAFHGYLPIDAKDAAQAIKTLEKESRSRDQTQIFIETPYRNNTVFSNLIKSLQDQTRLCVAADVTGKGELIISLPVKKWKTINITFPKTPAVFLFLAS